VPKHKPVIEELSSPEAEIVPVTSGLQYLLVLADFPNPHARELEYEVPVRRPYPCPNCGYRVARLQMAALIRVVDVFKDELRWRDWIPAWAANVLREHECSWCRQ
jgi:hypothetical protein